MRSYLPDFDLVTAADLSAVLELMDTDPDWRPIAGGTDLMVLFNAGRLPFRKLVSISNLPDLTQIEVLSDSVIIGAAATHAAILRHPIVQSEFPLLSQAAGWTGGPANQNRGTIGGNIANASPAADSPPALLVYDAEIELASLDGSRRIPYHQFHTGYKTMQMKPNELLIKIHLQRSYRPRKQYLRKVGTRKAQAISKVCLAGVAEMDGAKVNQLRVSVGSVAPVPLRCEKLETALSGQRLTEPLISQAKDWILQEIRPIDDIRSTSEYRSLVTQNLLAEFLRSLL